MLVQEQGRRLAGMADNSRSVVTRHAIW
jgi:hypothetical protein